MENKIIVKSSISLSTLVFIVFLVLKLAKIGAVATWSWWWITAPLWIPTGIGIILIIICLLLALFSNRID